MINTTNLSGEPGQAHIRERMDSLDEDFRNAASYGSGLYACGLGAIALFVAGLMAPTPEQIDARDEVDEPTTAPGNLGSGRCQSCGTPNGDVFRGVLDHVHDERHEHRKMVAAGVEIGLEQCDGRQSATGR